MPREPKRARGSRTYSGSVIRATKTIIREHIFVTTRNHPSISAGLSAELQLANARHFELRTDRQRGRLWLGFRQSLLVEPARDDSHAFEVIVQSATYQFFRGDGRSRFDEVVTYHWTPNDPNAKRAWPHLHIGSALVDPEARREPWAFHKTHIATGPLTANAFVRMTLEEFGVQPVVPDWERRITDPAAHA